MINRDLPSLFLFITVLRNRSTCWVTHDVLANRDAQPSPYFLSSSQFRLTWSRLPSLWSLIPSIESVMELKHRPGVIRSRTYSKAGEVFPHDRELGVKLNPARSAALTSDSAQWLMTMLVSERWSHGAGLQNNTAGIRNISDKADHKYASLLLATFCYCATLVTWGRGLLSVFFSDKC